MYALWRQYVPRVPATISVGVTIYVATQLQDHDCDIKTYCQVVASGSSATALS